MRTSYSTFPINIINSLISHRELMWELVKRDFIGRYKGSIVGVAWSLLHPLIMLVIYTLVFSVAFKARWGEVDSKIEFALVLFSGMIVYSFFAECLNRAPSIIVTHPNYVKKVVFPLEILPCVVFCSALIHFLIGLFLLLVFCIFYGVSLSYSIVFIPIVMLPLFMIAIGIAWLLASLGVYLQDIAQSMGVFTSMLMFLSPVFYKTSAFPEEYQFLFLFNPLTLPIEQLRDIVLWGNQIDWLSWTVSMFAAFSICYIGFWWFQKSRKGFADVL